VFVLLALAVAGLLALLVPAGGAAAACARRGAAAWLSPAWAPNAGSESPLSMLLALGGRVPHFLIARRRHSNTSQERQCSIWGRDDERTGADRSCRPVRLAYQPPASSIFLSEQIRHQQPASSTLLSQQTSTSHQPPANRTGCVPVRETIREIWAIDLGHMSFVLAH
jgi:hypothetical protein